MSEKSKTSTATIDRAKKVITDAVNEVIEAVQSSEIGIVKESEIAKLDKDKQVEALNKPVKKTVPKEVVPDYDPSDDLRETITALNKDLEKAPSRCFWRAGGRHGERSGDHESNG